MTFGPLLGRTVRLLVDFRGSVVPYVVVRDDTYIGVLAFASLPPLIEPKIRYPFGTFVVRQPRFVGDAFRFLIQNRIVRIPLGKSM